jgi:transcriptional regulator with XRE-family HTH domain
MNRKIKGLLITRGIKQKDIAVALGVKRCTVSNVISGRAQSRPIKRKIAELLKVDYEKLWGKAA